MKVDKMITRNIKITASVIFLAIIFFFCFQLVAAVTFDYKEIKQIEVPYAAVFNVKDVTSEKENLSPEMNLDNYKITFASIIIRRFPIEGKPFVREFLGYDQYQQRLQAYPWEEQANPLKELGDEFLQQYYAYAVDIYTAIDQSMNKRFTEGDATLIFYLKMNDEEKELQFLSNGGNYQYYDEKDGQGYAKLSSYTGTFRHLQFQDGKEIPVGNDATTLQVTLTFDQQGFLKAEESSLTLGYFVKIEDNLSIHFEERKAVMANIEQQPNAFLTEYLVFDDDKAAKNIDEKYLYVSPKIMGFDDLIQKVFSSKNYSEEAEMYAKINAYQLAYKCVEVKCEQ